MNEMNHFQNSNNFNSTENNNNMNNNMNINLGNNNLGNNMNNVNMNNQTFNNVINSNNNPINNIMKNLSINDMTNDIENNMNNLNNMDSNLNNKKNNNMNNMSNNMNINMLNNMSNNMSNNMGNNNMYNNMNNNMSNNMSNNMNNNMSNNMNNNMSNNMPNNMNNNMSNNIPNNMNNNMNTNNMSNNMNNNMNNNMPNNMPNNMNTNNMSNNMNNNMSNNMSNNIPNNMSNNMPNNMNNIMNNNMNNNMSNMNMNNNMFNNLNNNDQNESYAKVVIQALNILNSFKQKLFLNDNSSINALKDLTNSFKFLFSALFGNSPEENVKQIMNIYNQRININTFNIKHPYPFLKRILELLKEENQKAIMPQNVRLMNEQNWINVKSNFESCFNSFKRNTKDYDKSCICDSLYFSQFETYNCNRCGTYYKFSLLPMVEIDLDKCSNEGFLKYYLKKYLDSYFGNQLRSICTICKNQAFVQYKIISNSPILIIHLYRNDPNKNHNTEILLDDNLNLTSFIHPIDKIPTHKEFILRGYISYDESIGYFIDYNFKIDQKNFIWIRYNNNKYNQINNQYLNNCKPILLFYEAIDEKVKKSDINMIPQNMPNPNQPFQVNNNSMNGMSNMGSVMPTNQINQQQMETQRQQQLQQQMQMQYQQQMEKQRQQQLQQQMQMQYQQQLETQRQQQLQQQMQMQYQQQMQMQYQQQLIQQQNLMNNMNQILSNSQKLMPTNNTSNQNTNQQSNNINDNISVFFYLVSEDNPNQEDNSNKMLIQTKNEETINSIFNKYLNKLQKDEGYIKKLVFNGQEISKTSTQKVSEIPLVQNSKIKAFKNE